MIFINKPIVITHHAKERFQQRRVNMNNITKKSYKKLGIEGNAQNAELAANHVISLPVHPSLTQEDLDLVIDAVKQASDSFN